MKITEKVKIGLGLGSIGYRTTYPWIMAIIFAGFVVVGLRKTRSRLTISSPEQPAICLTLLIFNQPIGYVILERGADVGHRK